MKKSFLIFILVTIILGFSYAGNKRLTITPKVSYDSLAFAAKIKPTSGEEYRLIDRIKGASVGCEVSYLIKTKLEIYLNGSYLLPSPFRFFTDKKVNGKLTSNMENANQMKDNLNDFKITGYRMHFGAFYNFFDSGLVKLGLGGGFTLKGLNKEGTYKTSGIKTKLEAFSVGLGLKLLGNYYFNNTWSIFATIEPDFNFYSKIKDSSSQKSGACFSSDISAAIGVSCTI